MALSGSLREFDLTDIFQLLGQQKKTGRLNIQDKKDRGSAIFYRGEIISAEATNLSLTSMLCKYLIGVRQYPESRIREFMEVSKGNISAFLETLRKIQYLTPEEELGLSRMGIEDLACELFLFKDGQYRFEPLENVEGFRLPSVSFSTDAICMEAMRRADEWTRFQEAMAPDTFFVPISPAPAPSPELFVHDPSGYILALLNGRRSIADIGGLGFISRYRAYETLFQAWQAGQIQPLMQEGDLAFSSSSAKKPLQRVSPTIKQKITATMSAIGAVMAVLLLSLLLHGVVLAGRQRIHRTWKKEITGSYALNKYIAASLAIQTEKGIPVENPEFVWRAGYLQTRDLRDLELPK